MDKLEAGAYGFLLLTSQLGNPKRKPLTVAQFRELFRRWEPVKREELSREMVVEDFVAVGYGREFAGHIISLLQDAPLLDHYLKRAAKAGCVPVTRASRNYPVLLRRRLGLDSPGCLWAKGDLALLDTPMIALVGSRELYPENEAFAREVGRQAALQGFTLVSGNARGADKTAQNACLDVGGRVISVVADSLESHGMQDRVLYLSEGSFDEGFSNQRALSRNRVIHALGLKTFVAQANFGTGGTWSGAEKNLRFGWSDLYCFRDGSPAMLRLCDMGGIEVGITDLDCFYDLPQKEDFFDR